MDLLEQGKIGEAEAIYRQQIAAGSRDPVVYGNLAAICGMGGRFGELEALLQQALQIQPDYPDAHYNLAIALHQQGRRQEAISAYRRTLELRPSYGEAWTNLGRAQRELGQLDEALHAWGKALQAKPELSEARAQLLQALRQKISGSGPWTAEPGATASQRQAEAWNELGIELRRNGNLAGAIAAYQEALSLEPEQATTQFNLGNALRDLGDREGAINAFRSAIAIQPEHFRAYNNLGTLLHDQGDHQAALAAYNAALAIQPAYPTGLNNLGNTLKQLGEHQAAIQAFQRALALDPDYATAHNNLGTVWQALAEPEMAAAAYRKAIALRPSYAEAHHNLGTLLHEQGALADALASHRQALELRPDYPNAEVSLGMILMLQGHYPQGWIHYDRRFEAEAGKGVLSAVPPCRLWNGAAPGAGERLLVVSEQGLGDCLQFMRYVPHLRRSGIEASLCAPDKLHGLIRASGIDPAPLTAEQAQTVREGHWIPLLSLPRQLGVSPQQPLISEPYLASTPALLQRWQELLASERGPIIAINWQGNPDHERGVSRGRSLPLELFAAIAERTDATFLSLQKGPGSEQLQHCSFRHRFVSCQERVDETWDFLETAAMIAHCDRVISSDTAVAHLAGGMGKDTWLLLKHTPEWRWGSEGERCFWYPTMRLFRQRQQGDWPEVMQRVAAELAREWGEPGTAPPAAPQEGPGAGSAGILAPMALGELADRISILQIKRQHCQGEALRHVSRELQVLEATLSATGIRIEAGLLAELAEVNGRLWSIEDELREKERRKDFDAAFIALARSVYQTNDRRAALKKQINLHHGSRLIEEKSYAVDEPR